jgi:hypothetical protein
VPSSRAYSEATHWSNRFETRRQREAAGARPSFGSSRFDAGRSSETNDKGRAAQQPPRQVKSSSWSKSGNEWSDSTSCIGSTPSTHRLKSPKIQQDPAFASQGTVLA